MSNLLHQPDTIGNYYQADASPKVYGNPYTFKKWQINDHGSTHQSDNRRSRYNSDDNLRSDSLDKRYGEYYTQSPDYGLSVEKSASPNYDYYDLNYSYDDIDYEEHIGNIRKNNGVFRQESGDLSWLPNFVSTAFQVVSVLSNVFGGGEGGAAATPQLPQPQIDRNDVASAAGSGGDELDVAMGTLMAYGGKYLRQIGAWAYEYAAQKPAETLSESALPSQEEVTAFLSGGATGKPYLSTLPQAELEKLGLKAVQAGANQQKLQQAFVKAQISGDWKPLENEIAAVLGQSAVQGNPFTAALNLVTGSGTSSVVAPSSSVSSVSSSSVSVSQVGGSPGATTEGDGIIDRITRIWYGNPNGDPVVQQNIITRFVSEFKLEKEALQLQNQANSLIKKVNSFLGEDEPTVASATNNIDKIDTSTSSTGGGGGSWSNIFSSIPQTIGTLAVSAIKFVTPKASGPQNKIDTVRPGVSQSVVKPAIDLSDPGTVALGILGTAALGTLTYAAFAGGSSETPNRRISTNEYYEDPYQTSRYKRSAQSFAEWWNQHGHQIEEGIRQFSAKYPSAFSVNRKSRRPFDQGHHRRQK